MAAEHYNFHMIAKTFFFSNIVADIIYHYINLWSSVHVTVDTYGWTGGSNCFSSEDSCVYVRGGRRDLLKNGIFDLVKLVYKDHVRDPKKCGPYTQVVFICTDS